MGAIRSRAVTILRLSAVMMAQAACGSDNLQTDSDASVVSDAGEGGAIRDRDGDSVTTADASIDVEQDASCSDASNVSADPNNCGACGHGCQGGSCKNGACQPLVLALNQGGFGIAVDATNVYWTNYLASPSGQVMSCPIGGCGGAPTVLASNQASPAGIAIDPTNVYWANAAGQNVLTCAIGGGTPAALATNQGASFVAVDATHVYWNDSGRVVSCAIGACSGTRVVLASSQNIGWITVDATSVYWTNGSNVMKCAKGGCGGNPTTLASGQPLDLAGGITVDATNVYWTNSAFGPVDGGDFGQLLKVPIDGGTPTILASGQRGALGIAVDATNVYWTNNNAANSQVMKCAIGGCGNNPTVLASTEGPYGIVVDATSVYWTAVLNNGTLPEILKLAK